MPPLVVNDVERRHAWRGFLTPSGWACLLLLYSASLSALAVIARLRDWPISETAFKLTVGASAAVLTAASAWAVLRRGSRSAAALEGLAARGQAGAPCSAPFWLAAAACLACVLLAAVVASVAFHGFASSADEYGFLFEAQTFLRGRLVNPVPVDPELVRQVYLIAKDGEWVSQYLPFWPALLAAFAWAGLPTWLAAPACMAGTLSLLGWAALAVTHRPGIAVLTALACAASPFVVLNAATLFSHCASALLAIGAVAAQLPATARDSHWRNAATGACLGMLLVCRIDSFLVVGCAVACAWVGRPGRVPRLAALALGAAPFALAFAAYNLAVTGSPLVPPTVWGGNFSLAAGGLRGVEPDGGPWRALTHTAWRLGDLADTTTFVLPVFYLWALARGLRRHSLAFYDTVPIAAFALFLVFPDYGGWQMGPRYWFDGFVIMHLTVAREIAAAADPARLRAIVLLALLIPAELGLLPALVFYHAGMITERAAPTRLAAALPDSRAFILVGDFPSGFDRRFNRNNIHRAQDFMRNGPDLDGRVTFVRGDVPDALSRACRLMPGVAGYRFSPGPADPGGKLDPVRCPD